MDTRYKPSPEALNAFFVEVKENKTIPPEIKMLIVNYIEPLRKSSELCAAGLIWLAESEKPILSKDILNRGLNLSDKNQIPDKQKIVLLAKLAKSQPPGIADSKGFTFKDQIISTSLRILDRVSFKKVPKELINDFKKIPERYYQINTSYFYRRSTDRPKQINFIETFINLIDTLAKNGEAYEFEAIIIAATYYLMYQLEDECPTRRPGSKLYQHLQRITKISHTSEIPYNIQKLYFDELFKFIDKVSISVWKKSIPSHCSKFNVKHFVYDVMYDLLPKIQLDKHRPRSLPYVAMCQVGTFVSYGLSYTKEFALFKFAEDLYVVRGIGKNSIIITAAAKAGEYLSTYVGTFGGYFIKQGAIAVGELAEQKAVTFSLVGMLKVPISYLSSRETPVDSEPSVYNPESDPFECLLNIALIQAKKEKIEEDCEFFSSVITLYRLLPADLKKEIVEKVQQKSPEEKKHAAAEEKKATVRCSM